MATNYVQPGKVLTLTAPAGGVTSGLTYKVGSLVVVSMYTAAAAAEFEAATEGVYTLVKNTGEAWTAGAKLYWDNTAFKWTTTSTSNTLAGYATEAVLSATATGNVKLVQMGG